MPKRVAISTLDATTLDILNVIRENGSAEYQSTVPIATTEHDIPKVGEVICGYPAMANQFLNALINRIALVRIKSATFNNAYKELKKGYLEFGETVEEVFVGICKAREFSAEKAEAREFKRTIPNVKSAFHIMNWRVQYPITIQDEELRMAFQSMTGVQDLIAKIVNSVYVSAEYDEFLLFKYLMIKAISHGKMYPVSLGETMNDAAVAFRGMSNQLTFMSKKYNASGVTTTTPKEDQYIFMDAEYNASFDVNVLASAFNMDRAMFMGKLNLIDDWTTFDNDRFSEIMGASDQIEMVTDDELSLMADVKAVLIDKEWFQVYDNLTRFTEKFVASGLYWNYFYNTWKTVSSSPFSNAIVFVDSTATITTPETLTVEVSEKSVSENATIVTLTVDDELASLEPSNVRFIQTANAMENGVAVHRYGAIIFPPNANDVFVDIKINDDTYVANKVGTTLSVGDTLTFSKVDTDELTLSALSIGSITLSPTFDEDVTTYTGTGSTGASSTITATPTDENATVSATVNGQPITITETQSWTDEDVVVVTVSKGGYVGNSYKVTISLS